MTRIDKQRMMADIRQILLENTDKICPRCNTVEILHPVGGRLLEFGIQVQEAPGEVVMFNLTLAEIKR